MHDHIQTVVGRYKGRICGWDVVNEALNEDGTLRKSQWLNIIGEDYIAKAFQFAHEADPAAELYYNDYSLENEAKRNGAVELVKKLKAQGIPITVGSFTSEKSCTSSTATAEAMPYSSGPSTAREENMASAGRTALPAGRPDGCPSTLVQPR